MTNSFFEIKVVQKKKEKNQTAVSLIYYLVNLVYG